MKAMSKKQKEIIENNFNFSDDGECLELEAWTNGGVDMMIYIYKKEHETITDGLKSYYKSFDIDDEIDTYREDLSYCQAFTIVESVRDFEDWLNFINGIIGELEGLESPEEQKEKEKKQQFQKSYNAFFEELLTTLKSEYNQNRYVLTDTYYAINTLKNDIEILISQCDEV